LPYEINCYGALYLRAVTISKLELQRLINTAIAAFLPVP